MNMKKAINDYIDNLQYQAKQSDKFFVERNELYIHNQELLNKNNEYKDVIYNINKLIKQYIKKDGLLELDKLQTQKLLTMLDKASK